MPPTSDSLPALLEEIQAFLRSLRHPVVVEDDVELFDLTAAECRLTIEFNKLIFTAWNAARSLTRRVEDIAYRDRGRLGVFVRKPGGRASSTLEFRDLPGSAQAGRVQERRGFHTQLLAMLARGYPGWTFEKVSHRSNREHSFSTWYTRGLARQGRTAWAFLGLSDAEPPAAADAVLAFGLIWLDWLRSRSERVVVTGLKLVLPPAAVDLIAHRAAYLNSRALQLEILSWASSREGPTLIDRKDFGNVETRLIPRRQGEALLERHRDLLGRLLGDQSSRVDVVPDPTGAFLSLRVLGLEVARVEGQLAPRIYFGLEGSVEKLEEKNQEEFRLFLSRVLEARRSQTREPASDFYRLQPERWLESMLVRDITRIDSALSPRFVYPQVPAFSGADRGVIDILAATRHGRLAVVELKLQEEINLPLQALDYWLRVKWLQGRDQFQRSGYFPGLGLAQASPELYLVCPAFRFHSSTLDLLRYFHPSIKVVQVGLNDSWREGIKVLFRRQHERPELPASPQP